ncbi:MAG: glycosyltransferase [Dehalococcoidia bacterium]
MPKVSVIIPSYNGARFISEAIQSVIDQSFTDFEIIIVDDGSTDNTSEVVKGFKDPRIRYIYQENRGLPAARNSGILASGAEYIALLDSDDKWLPGKLELQVKAIESAPQVGVVYCDVYNFDSESGTIIGTFFKELPFSPPRGRVLSQFIQHYFGHPSTLLIRRNVFAQVGMFDETLRSCEDEDMLFRMASYFEFEVVPLPLLMYRVHAGQMSRNRELSFRYYIPCLNKALHSPVLNNKMRTDLRKRLSDYKFQYGEFLLCRGKVSMGAKEFWGSIKADVSKFLSSAIALTGRIMIFALKMMRLKLWRNWVRGGTNHVKSERDNTNIQQSGTSSRDHRKYPSTDF